jgi:glycosyltransferase involved in cell wall biosynthesis
MYIIGIDASRCRSGGSIAHIKGILGELNIAKHGISKVHIWSYNSLLDQIKEYPWLVKHTSKHLNSSSILFQIVWQALFLKSELKKENCDILFTVDASSFCVFSPQVVLSQDLLSYEPGIISKYKFSKIKLRLIFIYYLQNLAFRRANGVIFLSEYSASLIQKSVGKLRNYKVIYHGLDDIYFNHKPKEINFNLNKSVNCLYVSNAEVYKNQWHVVRAIELLRKEGFDVNLHIVGGGNGEAVNLLKKQIEISCNYQKFVYHHEFLPQHKVLEFHYNSDIFVFASSCEAFGISLLEAMASGLPIVCSNRSSLPEVLDNCGLLVNPEDPSQIAQAIKILIENNVLSNELSKKAKIKSNTYTWSKCSNETFSFITDTLKNSKYIK